MYCTLVQESRVDSNHTWGTRPNDSTSTHVRTAVCIRAATLWSFVPRRERPCVRTRDRTYSYLCPYALVILTHASATEAS